MRDCTHDYDESHEDMNIISQVVRCAAVWVALTPKKTSIINKAESLGKLEIISEKDAVATSTEKISPPPSDTLNAPQSPTPDITAVFSNLYLDESEKPTSLV